METPDHLGGATLPGHEGEEAPVVSRGLPVTGSDRVRGCCPLDCQDSCSWVAHVTDGVVTRVEGAKEHPITRGALCAKVNDYQARTYAPDRVLEPLRRVGAKGNGTFERISWDDALDLIAARLRRTIDEHGAESILPVNYLGSMGVVQRRALMRFFHAIGASRFHGSVCGGAGNILEAEGHPRGFDPELMGNARFVLLWGANLLTTAHHQWQILDRARREHGVRIVAIDPIRSRTARACDEHVSLRPGTDAILAAGIAHVMFAEGLVDRDHASAIAADLDAYRARVAPWTPSATQAVTDVEAGTIVRIAREFAAARPALIRFGVAPQQTVAGESVVRGVSALAILAGHWQLPGGGLYIESGPAIDESRAARPDLAPRPTRSLDLARLGEHLTSDTLSPPIKALVVWGMNPVVTQPDAERVRAGLARDDLFTVVLEHFLTDTARYADVVLPSTTQLEHLDVQGSWGHHYVTANFPAIAPLGQARTHGQVMRELSARMGLDGPALRASDEAIAASVLPEGVTLEQLSGERNWYKASPPPGPIGPGLRLDGPLDVPARPPAGHLQLLTPKSHWFLNTTFGNMPRQRAQMGEPTLEVHPLDAETLALVDGALVGVSNERGALRARVRLNDGLHHGVAALPGKWWGSPVETSAVANLLSPSAWTPGGQPAYNDTWVEVTPVPADVRDETRSPVPA